jgi:hypothetical protein
MRSNAAVAREMSSAAAGAAKTARRGALYEDGGISRVSVSSEICASPSSPTSDGTRFDLAVSDDITRGGDDPPPCATPTPPPSPRTPGLVLRRILV